MDIENLVLKHNGGRLTVKVESNEAMGEFYKNHGMSEICEGIEKEISSKHKGVLKTFKVICTKLCEGEGKGLACVNFMYSVNGRLTDSFEDYLCESVREVVRSFGFKVKIKILYLEEKMAKDKAEIVSSHINDNYEVTVLCKVCIADKDDKSYFNQLSRSEKSKLIRELGKEVTDILGINDGWYSLNDVYIDCDIWRVSYTFSTKDLLPLEMEYIKDISVDIVDVVRGKKASLI